MKHISEYGAGMPADSPAHELRKLPERGWQDEVCGITSIVIIPANKKGGLHDSGYRVMDFAACHYGKAYVLLSGCSDVIHLGGISGYNNRDWYKDGHRVRRGPWSIDCLPKSGLLQIFCGGEIEVGCALSSFEMYTKDERPEKIGAQQ